MIVWQYSSTSNKGYEVGKYAMFDILLFREALSIHTKAGILAFISSIFLPISFETVDCLNRTFAMITVARQLTNLT